MKVKQCTVCLEKKPISEFYKNKSKDIGVQYCCKDCNKLSNIERYYKVSNAIRFQINNESALNYNPKPEQTKVEVFDLGEFREVQAIKERQLENGKYEVILPSIV